MIVVFQLFLCFYFIYIKSFIYTYKQLFIEPRVQNFSLDHVLCSYVFMSEEKLQMRLLNSADNNSFSDLVSVYLKVFDHYTWKF